LPPDFKRPLCDLYCAFRGQKIAELKEEPPCDECIKFEVVTGILFCTNCKRWYPIIDEIPRLLPDNYRDEKEDLTFLEKYADKIPDEIKYGGKPFNLRKTVEGKT